MVGNYRARALRLDILIGNDSIFNYFDAGSVIGLTLHWHYMHISKQSYFIFRKTNWHQLCAVVLSGTGYEALQQPPWETMTALWKGLIVKGLGKVKRRYRIMFSEIQETGSMMS